MGQMKDGYFNYYGYYQEPTIEDYPKPHVCKFPDTGLYKSWCQCSNEGKYNFYTGKYERVTDG